MLGPGMDPDERLEKDRARGLPIDVSSITDERFGAVFQLMNELPVLMKSMSARETKWAIFACASLVLPPM